MKMHPTSPAANFTQSQVVRFVQSEQKAIHESIRGMVDRPKKIGATPKARRSARME